VGISSNVIDQEITGGGIDGIGVYTATLERGLQSAGISTVRVGAPIFRGMHLVAPSDADVIFALPLVASIGWSAITHAKVPIESKVERKIDVYHATDYRVPRFRQTPVVASIYDAIPLRNPEWASPSLRSLKNWLLRRSVSFADLVISISHAAVAEIEEHYRVPRERIRVAPPGVSDEWFTSEPPTEFERAAARWGLKPGYFLFVGTLQPRKNITALLDAYERLPAHVRSERQLLIVGKYGWAMESLRQRLKALAPHGRILWVDRIKLTTLRALYQNAGAFVFPSLAEGFGLPLVEALASGVTVAASNLPVLREVGGTLVSYFDPSDIDAIAHAMENAAAESIGDDARHARRQWARQYSVDTCAKATIAVYDELVSTR